jgi:hypothetical protein
MTTAMKPSATPIQLAPCTASPRKDFDSATIRNGPAKRITVASASGR